MRAALEDAERLVAQTTTRLAAEEARATALDQQVQAMQAQGPSILAALDSQTTNRCPDGARHQATSAQSSGCIRWKC